MRNFSKSMLASISVTALMATGLGAAWGEEEQRLDTIEVIGQTLEESLPQELEF